MALPIESYEETKVMRLDEFFLVLAVTANIVTSAAIAFPL